MSGSFEQPEAKTNIYEKTYFSQQLRFFFLKKKGEGPIKKHWKYGCFNIDSGLDPWTGLHGYIN